MPKRKRAIDVIIGFVEGYGDSMFGSDDSGVWSDIQLGFWMIVCFGVFLNDSSKLFGVFALILFFAFTFKMIWRYKKRRNAGSYSEKFSIEQNSRAYHINMKKYDNYNDMAREYYKDLGTNGAAANHEVRHTANTSFSRDDSNIVDSWDIKDPKPPWEK